MTLDVILNYCAVAAAAVYVMWGEISPWGWVALLAIFILVVIIAIRHAEQQNPSLEEQRSDFAQLLPKDPPVKVDRRFTSYRRASGLFDVEDK